MSQFNETIAPQVKPSQPSNGILVTPEDYTLLQDLKDKSDFHGKEIASQKKILDWTFGFIVAILVVCFVAIATFFLDAWRFHAESYEKFTQSLSQQQAQEILITNRLNEFDLKIQKIQFENKLALQKIELEREEIKTAKVTH